MPSAAIIRLGIGLESPALSLMADEPYGASPEAVSRYSLADARRILQAVWGYPDFRPGQRRAILAVLSGRDCLAVLPTGGGKSLCYQVPALLLPGLTIVVSPLISLMEDQVSALARRGVAAAFLSSTQSTEEQRVVREAVRSGCLKLLYLAPERMERITKEQMPGPVALLAVDEAHCISEWGHDFRPHYRTLGAFRQQLGNPPTLATTATATPHTRVDIVRSLCLRRPVTVVESFDRPNLWFGVHHCKSEPERLRDAATAIRKTQGSAIVYLPTRDRTDGIALALRRWGFAAAPYHAGLPGLARRALLTDFLDGRIRVMVATNAFGMGIDQPNVRVVAHLGIPPRPEAYYQEAGRAGRDGLAARCTLYWVDSDVALTGFLARGKTGVDGVAEPPVATEASRHHELARRDGLAVMKRYVSTRGCRRRVLLDYLGEYGVACNGCDRCSPPAPGATSRD